MPRLIIIMGVSGCGKSTIGKALSTSLDCTFLEGDGFHPKANIEKMSAGTPLVDADRTAWINDILTWVNGMADKNIVLACSALTPYVQSHLSSGTKREIVWIWLSAPKDIIAARLNRRENHFMSSALLDSQFRALSPPDSAIKIDVTPSADDIIKTVLRQLT